MNKRYEEIKCVLKDVFSPIQKTFQKEEKGLDAQLDFEEFVHYLQDYDKDLKLVVKSINRKNAGV